MSVIDNYIDRKIGKILLEKNKEKESLHIRSGRLSASDLGSPTQWQVLKVLGAESEPLDEYVVRKFLRGNHIEAWVIQYFDLVERTEEEKMALAMNHNQEYAGYRKVNGYIDAMVDTSDWDFPKGIIPVEVKSVANAKFKRITRENKPDRGHILQACLYGLAKEKEWVAVCYIASDDYRVQTYMIRVDDYKEEIDTIIDKFNEAIKWQTIPVFEPIEVWHKNKKYNRFPEFMDKSAEELKVLSKELFKNFKQK